MGQAALLIRVNWKFSMRIREILESASAGATSSGVVATVAQPLTGGILRRINPTPTKYKNSAPRTQDSHARR